MTLVEGYYRITVSLTSAPNEESYHHLHADILKDNVERLAFCDTEGYFTTSMHTIVYMERFKMLQVRIIDGTFNGHVDMKNQIQVEKLT